MALVRCLEHRPDERRTVQAYIGYAEPFGLSQSGIICGRSACENVGMIWLNQDEANDFAAGRRIFHVQSSAVKMRASDTPVRKG